jgi:hypothetical protein
LNKISKRRTEPREERMNTRCTRALSQSCPTAGLRRRPKHWLQESEIQVFESGGRFKNNQRRRVMA